MVADAFALLMRGKMAAHWHQAKTALLRLTKHSKPLSGDTHPTEKTGEERQPSH
jgi:hypothetical protein